MIMATPLVLFYPQGHEAHFTYGHAERPERVEAIRRALEAAGWWDPFVQETPASLSSEILLAVHTPEYLSSLEAACRRGAPLDGDTYTTPASWRLALQAAGGAVAVASAVWHGMAQRGFALTRPPGHHAKHGRGMGFCLLNNMAIATQALIQQEGAQRLAIVDLDLHHGNGTQDIFWERGDVFFISTHQIPLFPGTGGLDEMGAGPGLGTTANIPFLPFAGDRAYQAAMDECIVPLLDRFLPQMLLVSYGFDPHWRDPLGHLQLSAAGYGRLIQKLAAWADAHCQGRIALILEGGYDLDAAAACSLAVTAALLGESYQDPLGPAPRSEGTEWRTIVDQVKLIWGL
jgi:acetoin utilization deacetylase AcuC-like enzyme